MFGAADAIAMLSDFGVPVVYRGCQTRGVLNAMRVNDLDTAGMARVVVRRVLVVVAGTIGVPARDSEIRVDCTMYRIRDQAGDLGEVDGAHEFWELGA